MNTKNYKKKIKRYIRKKLYYFFSALNEFDFSKLRPVAYLLVFVGLALALSKLPTAETDNRTSDKAALGTSLAADIRVVLSEQSSFSAADIVALFLPETAICESEAELQNTLYNKALYSFYITGEEVSYLAEGNVSLGTGNTTLHLDGVNYTYHQNRLLFDRIISITTVSGLEFEHNTLYHVISTEDIFSLFRYISYRSLGLMSIYPKNADGSLLSDYQEVLLTDTGEAMTIGNTLTMSHSLGNQELNSSVPGSVVTVLSGYNLIDLVKSPNKVTACVIALFITLIALMWYIIPRLRRIHVWFRIYRIRSRKRSTHTVFLTKKSTGSRRGRTIRRV